MKIRVREAATYPDDKSVGTMFVRSVALEGAENAEELKAQAAAAVRDMGRGWREPNLSDALYCLTRCFLHPEEGFRCSKGFVIWNTTQAEFDAVFNAAVAKVKEALGPEVAEMWTKVWRSLSEAADEEESYARLVGLYRTSVEFGTEGTPVEVSSLKVDFDGIRICPSLSGWKTGYKVFLVSGASGNSQDFLDAIPQILKARKVEARIRKRYGEKFHTPGTGTYSVKVCDKDWAGHFDNSTKKLFRVKASSPEELLKTILTKIGFDDDILSEVAIETMGDVKDYLQSMEEMEGTMVISLEGPDVSYSSANYDSGAW